MSADDLVGLTVVLPLQHAGAVHAAPSGHIPGGGDIAAVLRYPSPEPSTWDSCVRDIGA
jgi:hypothetical protein